MKKFILSMCLLLLLAGCSNQKQLDQQEKGQSKSTIEENDSANKEIKDENATNITEFESKNNIYKNEELGIEIEFFDGYQLLATDITENNQKQITIGFGPLEKGVFSDDKVYKYSMFNLPQNTSEKVISRIKEGVVNLLDDPEIVKIGNITTIQWKKDGICEGGHIGIEVIGIKSNYQFVPYPPLCSQQKSDIDYIYKTIETIKLN